MKRVEVKVCMGTTCFVMGGAALQGISETIKARYQDKVKVTASTCLNLCTANAQYSKAPYVTVDGTVVSEATVDKILKEIDRKLA